MSTSRSPMDNQHKSSHTTSNRFDTHSLNDYANESYRVRWILEGKAIYKHLHRKDLVMQSSGNDLKALAIRTASTESISDDDSSVSSAEIDDSPRLQTPLWLDDKAIVEDSNTRLSRFS